MYPVKAGRVYRVLRLAAMQVPLSAEVPVRAKWEAPASAVPGLAGRLWVGSPAVNRAPHPEVDPEDAESRSAAARAYRSAEQESELQRAGDPREPPGFAYPRLQWPAAAEHPCSRFRPACYPGWH